MKNSVFITGGTGFVGSYVIKELVDCGYKVKALSKSVSSSNLSQNVQIIKGDILNPDPWTKDVEGCDIFINLVGIIRQYPKSGITFRYLHVEAVKNVMKICKKVGVKRLLHMSANGASPDGISEYQRTKFEAEELVESSELIYTIFRPSIIYGPGDEFINNFVKIMKKSPVFPIFGKGDYKLQPVFVGDVAASYVKSIDNDKCFNKVFCLGGSDILTYKEIILKLISVLGKGVYTPSVPISLIRLTTEFMEGFGFYPLTIDQLNMLLRGNICGKCEIFNILDFKPQNFDKYLKEHFFNK